MNKDFEKIKKKFKNLKVEETQSQFIYDNKIEKYSYLNINGLNGNPDLTLTIREDDESKNIDKIPLEDIFVFKDFLGIYYDKKIEVILTDIGFRSFISEKQLEDKPLQIGINFKKQDIKISIKLEKEENFLKFIASHIRGSFSGRYKRAAVILTIENLSNIPLENLETETRLLLNSILFDVEYNFNLMFEVVNINSILRRLRRRPRPRYELPDDTLRLTYKKYIPELIDYFHTAEKVDYLPFKFICYFHIIEYFQDKSAFFTVKEKLRSIMLKPDFSLNTNSYVSQALSLIKQESEKHQTDKIKIQRVFKQFIDLEEIKTFLNDEELFEHFSKESVLACSKPLTLIALDFSSDSKFYETLTSRIYSMRCSIVHSNPDFDDKKAVPFVATIDNIDKLRFEVELIMKVAKSIILQSVEK